MPLQNKPGLIKSLTTTPVKANPGSAKRFVDLLELEIQSGGIQPDPTQPRPRTVNEVISLLRHYGLCSAIAVMTFCCASANAQIAFGDVPVSTVEESALWVPTIRTLTIDGVTHDLSTNRTWTTSGGSVVGTVGFTTDGAGLTILTGTKGYFTVDYTGTITGWSITADGSSPTCTIDVWKIATGTALPTVSNTITASAKPALSTGNAIRSSTLSGWTTAFSAGDIFGFHVDAVTVATKITFSLETTR